MNNKVVLIYVFLVTRLPEIWAGWDNLRLTTESFRNCPSNTSYPNPFTEIGMIYNSEDESITVNSILKVTDEVSHGALVHLEMIRCMSPTDSTSCSLFQTFDVEFCSYLFGSPFFKEWTKSFQNFGPCPIKPGSYPIVDMTIDFSASSGPWRFLTNPEQYIGHWIMKVLFLNGQVLETCIQFEGDVKKKRRKTKKTMPKVIGMEPKVPFAT